jgi:lysophospholipase
MTYMYDRKQSINSKYDEMDISGESFTHSTPNEVIGNAYLYYKNQTDTEQVQAKEKNVLIIYACGIAGLVPTEKGFKHEKSFLRNYFFNNINFCDKEYTLKQNKENKLITPLTFYDRRIYYEIIELYDHLDSNNMNLDSWKKLSKKIYEYYDDFDAFIIIHGTDTMSYTASMLSFMLENLAKPVILTGSHIPLAEMRNDAQKNLIDALTIAGIYEIPEVTILFGSHLYRGNRTIKNDNLVLEAFDSPNLPPLASFGIHIQVNWDIVLKKPKGQFSVFDHINNNICIIKFFPILDDETFESFFQPPIEAVIIETYGSGNLPLNRPKILDILKEANNRGIIILNISQCRKGIVNASYQTGSMLEKIGVIFGGDMTVECALAKLSYLLGKVILM